MPRFASDSVFQLCPFSILEALGFKCHASTVGSHVISLARVSILNSGFDVSLPYTASYRLALVRNLTWRMSPAICPLLLLPPNGLRKGGWPFFEGSCLCISSSFPFQV
jgi:hypothetical protein